MRFLLAVFFTLFTLTANAGFEGLNQGTSLNVFNRVNCSSGIKCSRVKDKFTVSLLGGVQSRTAISTNTTLTIAQCGTTFYNSAVARVDLPEASTALGCRMTFIVDNASNFDVNPDNADSIAVLTNNVGDAVRSATTGTSLTLEAASDTYWSVIGEKGTWSDIN